MPVASGVPMPGIIWRRKVWAGSEENPVICYWVALEALYVVYDLCLDGETWKAGLSRDNDPKSMRAATMTRTLDMTTTLRTTSSAVPGSCGSRNKNTLVPFADVPYHTPRESKTLAESAHHFELPMHSCPCLPSPPSLSNQ